MERQVRLIEDEESIEGIKPVVHVVRNVSMSAAAKVVEIIIKKTYMIPHR